MKYFQFLTEDSYVQSGEYQVKNFYLRGQHWAPGVKDVVGDSSDEEGTSFPHTVVNPGLFSVNFTADAGSGADATFVVKVNGVPASAVIPVDAAGSEAVSVPVAARTGDVISVTVTGAGAAASDVSIVNTGEKEFPKFSADWAAFVGSGAEYDTGAYSIGIKPSTTLITAPRVKPVSLLYFVSTNSTQEQRTLVQYDGTLTDLVNAGIVGAGGAKITWSEEEYIDKFAPAGFNRFGKVLPKGMSESQVSELSSFTGDFVTVTGEVKNVTAYFSPTYLNNARPLFDYIYLDAGFSGDFTQDSGIEVPGYFLRWLGYAPSENVAPINRTGDGFRRDGYIYDPSVGNVTSPADITTSHDGVTYSGADEYNIRNFRRY